MTKPIWSIGWTPDSRKQLIKLDRSIQKRILAFLQGRVLASDNPRQYGKRLTGDWSSLWSYRVGDYRVIADIRDGEMVILVVQVDHRRQVYDT